MKLHPLVWLYLRAQRVYPREFRRTFGDEMAQVFDAQVRAAAAGGAPALLAMCGRELAGLASQGLLERLYALQARPERQAQAAGGPGLAANPGPRPRFQRLLPALLIFGALSLAIALAPRALMKAWELVDSRPVVNQVVLADMNGDGRIDAVLGVGRGSQVLPPYVLYNDGEGRLGQTSQKLQQWPASTAAAGDLTGDGLADVLLDITAGGVIYYKSDGERLRHTGDLAAPGPVGVMRLRPVLGDLNGDGHLDVFAAGCCGRPASTPDGEYLWPYSRVWLNNGSGALRPAQRLGDAPSNAAALADLNGDGSLDAFLANGRLFGSDGFGSETPNTVWFNDGQGQFTDSGQQLGLAESTAVALGDLNGDGYVDAVVGNRGADEVWFNDGSGLFIDSGQRLGSGLTQYVFLADLNGNGHLDIFAAGETAGRAWFNDGQGQFSAGRQTIRYGHSDAAALGYVTADVTADGLADVVVVTGTTARVWANDGSGRFMAGQTIRYR